MGKSILPNGQESSNAPDKMERFLNPDNLRLLMRSERIRWNLKPNKEAEYYDQTRLFKYSGSLHNEAAYQKMEIHTFPDNGANSGYAGMFVDSGIYGVPYNLMKWDKAISEESKKEIVNRTILIAKAKIEGKTGYGLNENEEMVKDTDERMTGILLDPYDGRAYLYSNDDPNYVNNETRSEEERLPERTIARIGDIPTRITQLENDLNFIADPDYRHTDNSFTDTDRFLLDNLDDRTFVYPEIARDKNGGDYMENYRVGLNGEFMYQEADGDILFNSQPDLSETTEDHDRGDRLEEAISSYGHNRNFSGVYHQSGFLSGIFRSVEELERVDLVGQRKEIPIHKLTPGAKRSQMYYSFDGKWGSNWYNEDVYNDSYKKESPNPMNMELGLDSTEPTPYSKLSQTEDLFHMGKLYQWRYNRISLKYYSKDVSISVVESGEGYKVNDVLRCTFADDTFLFTVTKVGANGQIMKGTYQAEKDRIFEQDPSTHGVGIPFSNITGVGHDAKLAIHTKVIIETYATQIKNNLYAYVDITPSVRSDNTSPWSDTNIADTQGGKVHVRSTAAGPAYSGINHGRGGPAPSKNTSNTIFYEHGGNATAGVHVHLFRYVINTQNPTWVIEDGVKVYTGEWVDQGPMGVERPCDIKALLFSNPDTNNFNNYYKFMIDSYFDTMNRNPDGVVTNNTNALSQCYLHMDQKDPEPNQRFTIQQVDPETNEFYELDVTDKVIYINGATGVIYFYNSSYKNDPTFGYGMRAPGWIPVSGAVTR